MDNTDNTQSLRERMASFAQTETFRRLIFARLTNSGPSLEEIIQQGQASASRDASRSDPVRFDF